MADSSQEATAAHTNNHDQHSLLGQQQLRMSPRSETLVQPGLEVAAPSENDKQFVNLVDHSDKTVINQEEKEAVVPETLRYIHQQPSSHRQLCGIRPRIFWALVVVVLIVLALSVGLGVGLGTRQSDDKATSSSTFDPSATPIAGESFRVGGSVDPSYYSTSGIWNGSGFGHGWQDFNKAWTGGSPSSSESVIYFQNYSGDIQWRHRNAFADNPATTWEEFPIELQIVGSKARNSTPISVFAYPIGNLSYWAVFCKSRYIWITATCRGCIVRSR